jgi:hypothetical protein
MPTDLLFLSLYDKGVECPGWHGDALLPEHLEGLVIVPLGEPIRGLYGRGIDDVVLDPIADS